MEPLLGGTKAREIFGLEGFQVLPRDPLKREGDVVERRWWNDRAPKGLLTGGSLD